MLEISVTFEEFQLVFNFMLFFQFNTIVFNSWKMQGSKNLGGEWGAAASQLPGLYGPANTPLQMESWARCLRGRFFRSIVNHVFFQFPSWYILELHIFDLFHSLYKTIWLTIIFLPLKEVQFVPDMDFFIILSLVLSQLELSIIELPKLTPCILMENCDPSIFPGWSILFLYVPAHKSWLLENLSSS